MEFYEHDGEFVPVPKPLPLRRAIRGLLLNAMAWADGHQAKAAAVLEVSARKLSYDLMVYDIPSATAGQPSRPKAPKGQAQPRLSRAHGARPRPVGPVLTGAERHVRLLAYTHARHARYARTRQES